MKNIKGIYVTDYKETPTDRGVAYDALIWMGEKIIGRIVNPGDGSYTRVFVLDKGEEATYEQKMFLHFRRLGWNAAAEKSYALDYTFAEHLIDMFEEGEISKDTLDLGFCR